MSSSEGGAVGRREVAYRLFAAEYDDADLEYSDSEEERAPNYVITPTGARVNRLFVVGVLTEVEPVSDDVLRARVVDPTGAYVVYAGQYQPEAVAFLETADVPSYVAVTGKARTFQPEGTDRVFTSVRPETVTAVDARNRDRWSVQAASHTLARVATMARALDREERGDELVRALESAGVEPGLAAGVARAIDHYGTTKAYLSAVREQAIGAVEVVAGERDSVPTLEIAPDDDGPVTAGLAAAPAVAGTLAAAEGAAPPEPRPPEPEPETAEEPAEPSGPDPEPSPDEDATAQPESETSEPAADDLGDYEAPDLTDEETPDTEPPDTETPEAFELDEAEREAVEEEFGTEFSSGSEIGEPGEADMETGAEPPDTEATAPEGEPAADDESPDEGEEPAGQADGAEDEAADAEVDLEDEAVATMADLDEGDGADRDAVVASVVEAHGADPEAVEAAIQEALMSGRCYEPTDGRLKAI